MKIGSIELGSKPVMLAPMEDVTDPSFRLICREMGAKMVYTEFVSAEALIRNINSTTRKLQINEAERPVAPSSLPTPPSTTSPQNTTPAETPIPSPNIKMGIEIESQPDGMISPVSIGGASKPESETGEVKTPTQAQPLALDNYAAGSSSSMEYEFSNVRVSSILH